MDFISQLNEAVNPGNNPVIFWIIAAVVLIFLIMILRSVLQVVMIIAGIAVIALGAAYYTGYDLSQLQLPVFDTENSSSENNSSGNNSSGTSSNTEENAPIEQSGSSNNAIGKAIDSLPDISDVGGGLFNNLEDALNLILNSFKK